MVRRGDQEVGLVELDGQAAAVDAVVAWCRRGLRRAEVFEIAVQDVPAVGSTTFDLG
jgi:hypothetical protein